MAHGGRGSERQLSATKPISEKHVEEPIASQMEKLRVGMAAALECFEKAKSGEEQRLAVMESLLCVVHFLHSQRPHIRADVLYRHHGVLAELFVGRVDPSIRKSPVRAVLTPTSKRIQHGMIAAAVAILSEGGARRGNLTRDDACKVIAGVLRKSPVYGDSDSFDWRRVRNIYLEIVKLRARRPKPAKNASRLAALVATVKDRRRRQALYVFEEALSIYRKARTAAPSSFAGLDDRKRMVVALLTDAIRLASRGEV